MSGELSEKDNRAIDFVKTQVPPMGTRYELVVMQVIAGPRECEICGKVFSGSSHNENFQECSECWSKGNRNCPCTIVPRQVEIFEGVECDT